MTDRGAAGLEMARRRGYLPPDPGAASALAAKEAAEQAQAAAQDALAAMHPPTGAQQHTQRLLTALIAGGLPAQLAGGGRNPLLERATRLLSTDEAIEDAALAAEVDRLRSEAPALFALPSPPEPAPAADPGRPPRAPSTHPAERGAQGREMARRYAERRGA